jgi:hypothetical protein
MTDDRDTQFADEDDEEGSLIEKAKEKIKDAVDAPEAADDPHKTNPVTGQLREP